MTQIEATYCFKVDNKPIGIDLALKSSKEMEGMKTIIHTSPDRSIIESEIENKWAETVYCVQIYVELVRDPLITHYIPPASLPTIISNNRIIPDIKAHTYSQL